MITRVSIARTHTIWKTLSRLRPQSFEVDHEKPPDIGTFVRAAATAAAECSLGSLRANGSAYGEYVFWMLDSIGVDRARIVGFLAIQDEARLLLCRDQRDKLAASTCPYGRTLPTA